MKKILLLSILFICVSSYSNNKNIDTNITKYKKLGVIWGFLKYHHPEISKGKYDWDAEFIKYFDLIKQSKQEIMIESLLINHINEIYKVENDFQPSNISDKNPKSNYDWIDSIIVNPDLKKLLLKIRNNKNIGDYYAHVSTTRFVKFPNEKELKEFNIEEDSHRILLFFRFWNAIQYWDVNKNLTKNDWLSILDEYINRFLNCSNLFEFEIIKSNLVSELNDSHSYYFPKVISDSIFKYKPAFGVININDTLVVNFIYNETSCKKNDIKLGDAIVNINQKTIRDNIDQRLFNLISAAHYNFLSKFSYYILCSPLPFIDITCIREGKPIEKQLTLENNLKMENPKTIEKNHFAVEKIRDDVIYINLAKISQKQCDSIFKSNPNGIDNLIIDLRNNVSKDIYINDLCDYLINENKEFVKVIAPLKDKPGESDILDNNKKIPVINSPFTVGKSKRKKNINGKIILMVGRRTQSHGEFFGMAIQQADNVITIGTQTAGSVMNITTLTLPDGTNVDFTSFTALYPKSLNLTQKNGLHIDQTLSFKANEYDPELYIKTALNLLN